ncbi:hypothetical protein YC2023_023790 [Brassica napus]
MESASWKPDAAVSIIVLNTSTEPCLFFCRGNVSENERRTGLYDYQSTHQGASLWNIPDSIHIILGETISRRSQTRHLREFPTSLCK